MMLARQPLNFWELTLGSTVGLGLRYLIFAGIVWLLGYWLFKRSWFHRKIIAKFPQSKEVWREIGYSALSMLIFGLVGAATVYASRQGWTQMYGKIGRYGMVWFWLRHRMCDCDPRCLVLLDASADASPETVSLVSPGASSVA